MALRALLVDAFGTILDSDPPWETQRTRVLEIAWRKGGSPATFPLFLESYERERALDHRGRSSHDEFDFVDRFRRTFESLGADVPIVRAQKAAQAYFEEQSKLIRPLEEAPSVLQILRRSFRIALVSNYPDGEGLRRAIEREGLLSCFDALVISGEVGKMKPHSLPFREALDLLGVEPPEAVMVGNDPEIDIRAAKELGLTTIWIPYPRDLPGTGGADFVVRNLRDLPPLLESIRDLPPPTSPSKD